VRGITKSSFTFGLRGVVEILMNSGAAIIHRPDIEAEHVDRGNKLNWRFSI
jgi:hypothetical protein